jgi:hypothetical protein
MIWFGWMSDISQLASRVGGGGSGAITLYSISLHYVHGSGRGREGVVFHPHGNNSIFILQILLWQKKALAFQAGFSSSSCDWRILYICKSLSGANNPIQVHRNRCKILWAEFRPSTLSLTKCALTSIFKITSRKSALEHTQNIMYKICNICPFVAKNGHSLPK